MLLHCTYCLLIETKIKYDEDDGDEGAGELIGVIVVAGLLLLLVIVLTVVVVCLCR